MLSVSVVPLLLLFAVVQFGQPNPLNICGDDVAKYVQCVQSGYGKELERMTNFDETTVQSKLTECFTENKCVAPPEYTETDSNNDDDDSDGSKAQPGGGESQVNDDGDEELPEAFETKMILSERAFPGSKGQEYNKSMSQCLQKAEEDQKKTLLACMQSSLTGFKYPKDSGIPRVQDFVDSAMRGLTTRRGAFEVEANAVYYHLMNTKSTCKAWRQVDACLKTVIRNSEDSSYDLISKSEGMRDKWCKVHGGCLKSSNVKCHKVIESLREIECDCLRKIEKELIKAIGNNYETCLGYKLKTSLVEAKVGDTMDAVCGLDSVPPECSKV